MELLERLETKIFGLDRVLKGGIPRYSTVLIAGPYGSGKTVLCQNIFFNFNRATGQNVLYLNVVFEPQDKFLCYQQQFSFFDGDAFMDSVIFQDIGSIIKARGIIRTMEIIDELVAQLEPALLAIDSLQALSALLPSEREFRDFIFNLNMRLSGWPCTVFLVGEYVEEEINARPEAAIADGIIYLYTSEQKRFLRILKMRGTNYEPGEHLFQISAEGVLLFPQLTPSLDNLTWLKNPAASGNRNLRNGRNARRRLKEKALKFRR